MSQPCNVLWEEKAKLQAIVGIFESRWVSRVVIVRVLTDLACTGRRLRRASELVYPAPGERVVTRRASIEALGKHRNGLPDLSMWANHPSLHVAMKQMYGLLDSGTSQPSVSSLSDLYP